MKSVKSLFSKSLSLIALTTCFALFTTVPTNAFLDDKFKQEVETEKVAVKLVRDVQKAGYNLVTTEELKSWIDSKKEMVIVDTMPYEDSYKKSHIPGAVQFLFPIPDMNNWETKETDGKTEEDFKKLLGSDLDKTVVIYCGFVKCTRSHNGAVWAKKLGYKNVYRYSGGIFAWKGAGFESEKVK
ncbi:MAG: rhodanese-like domain-containing protein [Desulfamplus sp.]|nr:rhodanese-like domain-containing protein [Desulfamplus sp.]